MCVITSIGNHYIRFDLFTNEVVREIFIVEKDEWEEKRKKKDKNSVIYTYQFDNKSMKTSSALERHRIAVITSSVIKVNVSSLQKTEAMKQIKSTF